MDWDLVFYSKSPKTVISLQPLSQIAWPRDQFVAKGLYFVWSHQSKVWFPQVVVGCCMPRFGVSYCNAFWSHCIPHSWLPNPSISNKYHQPPKWSINHTQTYVQPSHMRFYHSPDTSSTHEPWSTWEIDCTLYHACIWLLRRDTNSAHAPMVHLSICIIYKIICML